jgi:hypothetical protein
MYKYKFFILKYNNMAMAMGIAPEEDRFAMNTNILAQAIQESITKLYNTGYRTIDPSMIQMAAAVISAFDKHYLIKGFIENSHDKCWVYIKDKNEEFFLKNSSEIFKYLPMDRVNLFMDLFTTCDENGVCVISDDLKDEIWGLLQAMVKISIKYIHKMRVPKCSIINNVPTNTYNRKFFDEVELEKHAKSWNINLEFPNTNLKI